MTDDLHEALSKIERGLVRLGRQILLNSLQAGLQGVEVRSMLGSIGLPSTPELETLYGWRNGTSTKGISALGDIWLTPGFYLESLEDAALNYLTFVGDSRWTPGWLPIFANGGGDFYVIDLTASGAGAIRHFRIDEVEHPIEFSSLRSFMETVAEGFERRIFYVDSDGYLEMDDLDFVDLAMEMNSDVAYWRDSA